MSAASATSRGGGGAFIALVVGLLASVVAGNLVLLRVAGSDPSVAAEPDAYRKAEAWDAASAERRRSDRLGWSASVRGRLREGSVDAILRLADGAGAPVGGATVSVEAFSIVRSGRRVELRGATDASGQASFVVPDGRAGLWEWRVRAERGPDTFLAIVRDRVAAP